jgi:putative transposase
MPNFRRAFVPGGTYFFTVVTADQAPILTTDPGQRALHDAIAACRRRWPFELSAMVLLPDHSHAMWTLPAGDADFSRRWAWIKREFSARYLATGGAERTVTANQHLNRRRGVWQPRFYEHVIRDQDDFNRHVDYIHYNPVKHGLVTCPHAWEFSSFHKRVAERGYDATWCCSCDGHLLEPIDFSWAEEFEME